MKDSIKIAFIGDYSGVNSNLAKVLKKRGIEVVVISEGDGYKNYPRDINIETSPVKSNRLFKLVNLVGRWLAIEGIIKYIKNKDKFLDVKDYDSVIIVNPIAIESFGVLGNYFLIKNLINKNKSVYLQAIGDDYFWVKFCMEGGFKYSPLSLLSYKNFFRYEHSLRYLYGLCFASLNKYCVKKVNGVIYGLVDYKHPYLNVVNKLCMLPFCILDEDIIDKVVHKKHTKVIIFNSWQKGKELRKGNHIFHDAMLKLLVKYPNDIEYIVPDKNVSFLEYKSTVEKSDIIFDQCFSYDRGMTAVFAMARGKVVFTGWEDSVLKEYNSNLKQAAINAIPCSEDILLKLEFLMENRNEIEKIKEEALLFVKSYHSEEFVYSKFMDVIKL